MDNLHTKYFELKQLLKEMKKVTVAFSGGVDSTFLLKTAHDVLGNNVLAITARSLSFPERELKEATAFAEKNGIEHLIVDSEELEIEGFSKNPTNRCYLCKKELFSKMQAVAKQKDIENIVEGSNADDNHDYRPGLLAVAELGIKSPLREIGLTKSDIRQLSKELELTTWNKQSFACLSSRFPYGENITPDSLKKIDLAEQFLLDLGFYQVRVRYHGNLARIEIDESGYEAIINKQTREKIETEFKKIGFTYVALDMKGYRTGSMNETLTKQ